jgi:hypothetical protein
MSSFSVHLLGACLLASALVAGCGTGAPLQPTEGKEGRALVAQQEARFAELCKQSGYRGSPVAQVQEGVRLLSMPAKHTSLTDQFTSPNLYADDEAGADYYESYLVDYFHGARSLESVSSYVGFSYVEVPNSTSGLVTRVRRPRGRLTYEQDVVPQARYGIRSYEVTSHSDRNLWITGSRIELVDISTGAVVALKTGYMRDPLLGGLGERASASRIDPWFRARNYACPSLAYQYPDMPRAGSPSPLRQHRRFADKFLRNIDSDPAK